MIGLTGKNCAGKGAVAGYLTKKRFISYSLSDIIRDELTKKKMEHSRENMIRLGNELRAKFGPGYIASKINEKVTEHRKKTPDADFVIDSIRSPFEVKELQKNREFILVNVDAPIETRFRRMAARNRIGDAKTIDELRSQEALENKKSDTNQQLDETIKMASLVLVNDSTFRELYKKIDRELKKA